MPSIAIEGRGEEPVMIWDEWPLEFAYRPLGFSGSKDRVGSTREGRPRRTRDDRLRWPEDRVRPLSVIRH